LGPAADLLPILTSGSTRGRADFIEIAEVEDLWYEPAAMYFRVRTSEGKRFTLRYDESEDDWTLRSGFDGDELLAWPSV
jgi:hypothetical protein